MQVEKICHQQPPLRSPHLKAPDVLPSSLLNIPTNSSRPATVILHYFYTPLLQHQFNESAASINVFPRGEGSTHVREEFLIWLRRKGGISSDNF